MPLTVTLDTVSSGWVDVRWSSTATSMFADLSLAGSLPHQTFFLVKVATGDTAAGCEWIVIVRDSRTSALRLDLEQSGIVGTPVLTVKRCRVTQSVLGDEQWTVEQTGTAASAAGSGGVDSLGSLLGRMSLSSVSSATASDSVPVTVRLQTPQPSYDAARFRAASRYFEEFTRFDITVHRDKYDKAAVSWNYPSYHRQPDKWQVTLENVACPTRCRIQFVDAAVRRVEFDVTLKAGNCYRVTVTALQQGSTRPHVNYRSIGTGETQFKAELTMNDLTALRDKAKRLITGNTFCRVLYRNKSPEYFSDVFDRKSGVMRAYIKDNSGDQASAINGQINGLFFMAEVKPGSSTGEPCGESPFGTTRFIVPVDVLLSLAPQLYFSDFYCMRGRFHYVTLVMTRPRSAADDFCRRHLLPLSIDDADGNPFLFRRAGSGEMRVATGVKVEVFFTEDIDVGDCVRRRGATMVENVRTVGKGSSTPGGLPKNSLCHVCNLRPPFHFGLDLF